MASTLTSLQRQATLLVSVFDAPFRTEHRSVIQTVRAGVSIWTEGEPVMDAIQNAQVAALRADPKAGRPVAVFDDGMRSAEIAFGELELELRAALEQDDEIQLHYQPIFDIVSGRLVGFEALVRWIHSERGMVSPGQFIPVAEATGLIVPLGYKILSIACQDLIRFDGSARLGGVAVPGDGLFMSVNLSVRQLSDQKFVTRVGKAFEKSGIDPRRIKLELTESEATGAFDHIDATLNSLKEFGVSLSIDDFGTGYSSLSQLHSLPFDVLKIDRSFVKDIADSEQSRAVVKTVVDLAKSFELATVAEGIENEQTLRWLDDLGVEMAQGFHTGRPQPFADAVACVAQHKVA